MNNSRILNCSKKIENTKTILKEIFENYRKYDKRKFTPEYIDKDPIVNILTFFKIYEIEGRRLSRIKYDGDAYYFYKLYNDSKVALRGDTMISFWTIYKYALKIATGRICNKSSSTFDELIAKRNESGYKEVNDKFSKFAELYYTPGNFILLPPPFPDGRMNNNRYRCSEDRIDKSLLECFNGGTLSKYFGDDKEQLKEWIKDQKLDSIFKKGILEKDKIIPFNLKNPYIYYSNMNETEINEFLVNVEKLIKYRNSNEKSILYEQF